MKCKFEFAFACAAAVIVGGENRASADVIAAWNFNNYSTGTVITGPTANSGDNAATATAMSLGMTNSYTYANGEGPGAVDGSNIAANSVAPGDNFWRIVGNSNSKNAGAGMANGWNTAAPQYSQGAQFNVSTTGFSNLQLTFGWQATSQGVADLQVRSSTNGGATWTNVGSSIEMTPADVNVGVDYFTFSLAAGTNAVELVSAYNPTLGTTYASATSAAAGAPVAINNNSGNWRFTDVSISGAVVSTPEPSSMLLCFVAGGGAAFFRWRKRKSAEASAKVA